MMKKLKYLLLTLAVAAFTVSCENDGGDSVIVLEDGVVPNMAKVAGADPIIDLVRLTSGEVITLNFTADVAQGSPASTDIVAVYQTLAGPAYHAVMFSDASLPGDFTITTNDIVAAFSELTSTADILLGDVLKLTARFTRPDGTVLNILNEDGTFGVGANIQTTVLFTVVINYPVSCPSDLSGTYLVTSQGMDNGNYGAIPAVDLEYTMTVTDLGGGDYNISEYSAGVFDFLYCPLFGICGDLGGGTITDVCGTLNGTAGDCCGSTYVFTGTVNEDGTWTTHVKDAFMEASSVWVKQ